MYNNKIWKVEGLLRVRDQTMWAVCDSTCVVVLLLDFHMCLTMSTIGRAHLLFCFYLCLFSLPLSLLPPSFSLLPPVSLRIFIMFSFSFLDMRPQDCIKNPKKISQPMHVPLL